MTQEQEDRVRQRAYEIWEREGCPDDQDLDHWLQAEREMTVSEPQEAGEPASADLPAQSEKRMRRANGNRSV